MVSEVRQNCALINPENGPLPHCGGSAEVSVPGRRPFGAPRDDKVEPAAGCYGIQRSGGSPGPRYVQGRFASPPGAPPQGYRRPRTGALTTTWRRWVAMSVPAATMMAGAVRFRPSKGRTKNEAIYASRAQTQSPKMA